MKLALLAFIVGTVLADDKPAGTPCSKAGECGDATKVCCGVATGGKVCTKSDCSAFFEPAQLVPNVMVCNTATPGDIMVNQANFDNSATLYAKFAAAGFKCVTDS